MKEPKLPERCPELQAEDQGEDLRVHRRDLWSVTLNRTAAFLWRACDGKTPLSELSAALGQDAGLGSKEAEELARRGL